MGVNDRQPQTLSLNGDRVRSIREGKSLTQLYIAEVVGVTVDTVSRWENNRTATVRRDNAEALAGALEVPLDEIARREEGQFRPENGEETPDRTEEEPSQPSCAPEAPAGSKSLKILVAAAVIAVLAASAFFWVIFIRSNVMIGAKRLLPPYSPPGSLVPVVVKITTSREDENMVVVKETLPPGWTFVGAVPAPDQGPGPDGTVKWIAQLKNGSGRISYLVKAPMGRESSRHFFKGEVVGAGDKGHPKETAGPSRIDLEYVHWADEDADFRIDDAEVLSALERLEPMRSLGLDPADLRALWGAGVYSWDKDKGRFTAAGR